MRDKSVTSMMEDTLFLIRKRIKVLMMPGSINWIKIMFSKNCKKKLRRRAAIDKRKQSVSQTINMNFNRVERENKNN